jgi:hypothetical protein
VAARLLQAMPSLIHNRDLKSLLQGVAGVAACGLMLGAAMHPTLNVGDKPGGPQMLLSGGGPRASDGATDRGVGAYAGRTPEYVVGTDWSRPPAPVYADTTPAPAPEDKSETVVFTSKDDPPVVEVTHTAWRDEPRPEPSYPSARGGAYYDADLPAPPPAPDDDDDADSGEG